MGYIDLIKERGYVKNFQKTDLKDEDRVKVKELIYNASESFDFDLDIHLYENVDFVKKQLKNANIDELFNPSAYLVFTTNDEKKGYENTGYVGEWIISRLIKNDIDASWLRFKGHDKKIYDSFEFEKEGYLITLIAIGYGQKESSLAKLIKNKYRYSLKKLTDMGYSDSLKKKNESSLIYQLNIREFVFYKKFGKKIRDKVLKQSGLLRVFQELHFAPTITYQQLWRVLVDDGKIFVMVISHEKIAKIETGIIKFYLKEALTNNGIRSSWEPIENIEDKEKYNFPENIFVTGYFKY